MEKTVISAIKERNADQIVNLVTTWVDTPDPNLSSNWDLQIGNTMWTRCIAKDAPDSKELKALYKIFKLILVKYLDSKDEHVILRLQTMAVLHKFFVVKNKLVITEIGDKVIDYISKNYDSITKDAQENFYTTTNSFYVVIWNMMRDNVAKLGEEKCLSLVSQSLQFLMFNIPNKLETAAGKLYQCNSIVLGCANSAYIVSFLTTLVDRLEEIIKLVTKNTKFSKNELHSNHFEALYQFTLNIARYLISNNEVSNASLITRNFINCWKPCYKADLLDGWRTMISYYITFNEFILSPRIDSTVLNFQDIDIKLNKKLEIYTGYKAVVLYNFTESMWHCMLHAFKNGELVTCDDTDSKSFVKFLLELQTLADALDIVCLNDYVGSLVGKLEEIRANLLMLPLRFFSDRVNQKEMEITSEMNSTVESCLKKVMKISSKLSSDKIKTTTDNYNRMCHCCSQIAFGYQKRKSYTECLAWCIKAEKSLNALKRADAESESIVHPYTLYVLIADCNRHLNQPEQGLRFLARILQTETSLMDSPTAAFDLYEVPSWSDWNNHWNQLKRDLYNQNPEKVNKTVIDYIQEEESGTLDQNFKLKALRHELNSYFTNRQVIPPAMLSVGQQLEENSVCYENRVLGLLSQIVAIWWSDESQITLAIDLCEESLEVVNENKGSSNPDGSDDEESVAQDFEDVIVIGESDDEEDAKINDKYKTIKEKKKPTKSAKNKITDSDEEEEHCYSATLLTSLIQAWKGLCIWRKNTVTANRELEEYHEICSKIRRKNKEEGVDDELSSESDHSYVGNTTLTLEDELAVTTQLVSAIDQLFDLIQFGDAIKVLFDAYCPALIMCTSRIVSHLMLTFGHSIYAIKSWQVTYFLAKTYDRKGLTVLCASELLKLVCSPDADYVQVANEINEEARKNNLIKINKGMYYRLHLAYAIAYYNNKSYEAGVPHLAEVLQGARREGEQFDSTHHVIAEAFLVLAWYKRSAAVHNFDLSAIGRFNTMTVKGLMEDGFRTLAEMIRKPEIISTGWTDINHNHFLISTLLQNADKTVSFFMESGNLFEARSVATEIVNFALSFACPSRSVQMLTYLASQDLTGNNFHNCIMKLDIVNKCMQKLIPHHVAESDEVITKYIKENLNMPNVNAKTLECRSEWCWTLKLIEVPPNISGEMYPENENEGIVSRSFTHKPFKVFPFVNHPLNCYCYICTHPSIIPDALKFLHLQAKYAKGMKKSKICSVLFELSKRQHLRAMFRIMYNRDKIISTLSINKLDTQLTYKVTYTPFFIEPGIHRLLMQMEVTPTKQLYNIINTMNNLEELFNIKDPKDMISMSIFVEIIFSAIMDLEIVNTQEISKFNDILLEELTDEFKALSVGDDNWRQMSEKFVKQILSSTHKDNKKGTTPVEGKPSDKLDIPKVPKKGLKMYTAHKKQNKPKTFTMYEDDEDHHLPKPIPLVDLDNSDQEKENENDEHYKWLPKKPSKTAKPEKTRGKGSDSNDKGDGDSRASGSRNN